MQAEASPATKPKDSRSVCLLQLICMTTLSYWLPKIFPKLPQTSSFSDDNLNTGVLIRCHRLLGRVVRAAVPIQALMLLLLGVRLLLLTLSRTWPTLLQVSSIVPLDQDELICSLQNNLQRSLEPMLQWSNGPPPIWKMQKWCKNDQKY